MQKFFRYWAQQNPRWVGETNEVYPENVMVWAGILNDTIIGPFFFERNVTGETYSEMLTDHILPELHRKGFDSMDVCYQHDAPPHITAAPPHITAEVRQILDENFMSWIGRGTGDGNWLPWPPRSPDLNMLDFFLWGVLQHRVNLEEHRTIESVERTLLREAGAITHETMEKVHFNLKKRLHKCIEVDGALFEYLLK